MNNKAVILGNNYYIGLSTIRCLGMYGIHTVAADYSEEERYGAKSKYCSEKIIVPHYKKDSENFIDALIDYAKKQDAKPVLIPCHDSYVEVLDTQLDRIREYYLIPQTEQGLYTKVMNKETLEALAVEKGIKVPETIRVDEDDFAEKIETIIKFPCLVKPTDSPSFVEKFRRKLFKVHSMDELNDALKQAKDADEEVIVQRIIPGFDDHMHTFDAYLNQDGKVTHWVTCQKLRQYPINFGASVYTVQKYIPELVEQASDFLEAIKFKGFAEIEFKKDAETGDFYLIEINARITNLNDLLAKVGMNIPYITYMELTGAPLAPTALKETTNRAFWYGYEDMLAIRDYIKTGQLSVMNVIKSLIRPKAYAIWDWKDPKPAFAYTGIILSKVFKRIGKR
ncbi:carboxylate--amine ligase [Virgibacillus profundi]|uniref:Carboxylate--amine ligase n=1 Tax=Virgibacillus profundi TaxID=2024555 RepID=A0A2A2IK75_9BACI|nr:carboxylate--amine ligase [Virgibacillus profundi]PAV31515.1 carboxylate--amine ligase [Virgibacillus profundi]PXY55701.1 carboxylate--amine ligase [Virgibacillus profundi]